MQLQPLDLNGLITDVTRMLSRLLGEHITLQFSYFPNLPQIQADRTMIEQIIINLAVNARDAMAQGGCLRIATSVALIDEAYVQAQPSARPGRFCCLMVTDSGCGMDEETMSHIFEPFFTTKEIGKGTGLGLATVYGITQQHKGWIEVQSEPGHGATFKVYFPCSPASAPLDPVQRNIIRVQGGNETLLVVEDEISLRKLLCTVLFRAGYRVQAAANGPEALELIERHQWKIDLLITDMVMPRGMTGKDLALELRKKQPDVTVIFTSGYTVQLDDTRQTMGSDFYYIPKPYRMEEMAAAVRECLDLRRTKVAA
jgi:CheY-like chemotaxis protein